MQRESLKSRLARNVTGTAVITVVALIALVILQCLAVRNLFVATQWTGQRDAVSAVRRAETMTIAFGSATLLILLIGLLAIRRSYRARLVVEAEVMRLNQELEQRVNERTRELTEQAELLDVAHDAILVREMDGTIRFWNKGAESIYGWSKEEAVGKLIHKLLQTEFPLPLPQLYQAIAQYGNLGGRTEACSS